jgi:cell cycle arrest protein BUB3
MFAVTTWDGTARIYEIVQSNIGYSITQKFFIKVGTPVLSCCWNGQNTKLYVGCGDNILRSIELETSKITNVGKHNNAIKDVFFIPNKNLILSTSYDKNINIWQDGNMNPIANVPLNNKLYTASFKYPLFAGGLS